MTNEGMADWFTHPDPSFQLCDIFYGLQPVDKVILHDWPSQQSEQMNSSCIQKTPHDG